MHLPVKILGVRGYFGKNLVRALGGGVEQLSGIKVLAIRLQFHPSPGDVDGDHLGHKVLTFGESDLLEFGATHATGVGGLLALHAGVCQNLFYVFEGTNLFSDDAVHALLDARGEVGGLLSDKGVDLGGNGGLHRARRAVLAERTNSRSDESLHCAFDLPLQRGGFLGDEAGDLTLNVSGECGDEGRHGGFNLLAHAKECLLDAVAEAEEIVQAVLRLLHGAGGAEDVQLIGGFSLGAGDVRHGDLDAGLGRGGLEGAESAAPDVHEIEELLYLPAGGGAEDINEFGV